jgi:hypothetical protein
MGIKPVVPSGYTGRGLITYSGTVVLEKKIFK